jgi:transketolase
MTGRLDELCVNTIRFLSIDAVEKAKSGHPGAPLGMAPMAFVLWDRFLEHNPQDPSWPDRDRFILSAGHASALLYSLLHLTGYDLSLDEIKNFRQWGSRTPGHPEYRLVPGVESTTGPLGQGLANGVGIAIAERWLAAHYNRTGHEIIDHHTYVIVSDGDLMEGIASEAASLAGTLGLAKLICLYDDNGISIDGSTDLTFREDVGKRFEAYGWQVIGAIDGMNLGQVDAAITEAKRQIRRPSLIICNTIIGYGSPNRAGTAKAHGEPLGEDEVRLTKKNLGWPHQEPFTIPDDVMAHFRKALDRGKASQHEWNKKIESYAQSFPEEANSLSLALEGRLPEGWDRGLDRLFADQAKPMATRTASGKVLNAVAENVPNLVGGSADLSGSNKTILLGRSVLGRDNPGGNNIHFGVREHAMAGIVNGMALHGGVFPFGATFLVFSDYMRASIRVAALSRLPSIFVFTHDSIGVGEDGPTHQPVEHLAALRTIPNLNVIRPADATETVEAWKLALERRDGPTALVFSRQGVPLLDRTQLTSAEGVRRGGYVLWESSDDPQAILIGTGTEVQVALDAGRIAASNGVSVRVVSLPSWEIFDAQPREYRESVLPSSVRTRVSIEAGTPMGWEKYTGADGFSMGVSRFGASAPGEVVFEKLGLTAEAIAEHAINAVRTQDDQRPQRRR